MKTRQEIIDSLMRPIEDARHAERCYAMSEVFDGSTFEIWCGRGDEGTDQVAVARDLRAKLESRLSLAEIFKTCADFKHLNVKCSDCVCIGEFERYEMKTVPLPEGGYAWVCCAIENAIRRMWAAQQDRLPTQKKNDKAMGEGCSELSTENGNPRPYDLEKIHGELPFGWETCGDQNTPPSR